MADHSLQIRPITGAFGGIDLAEDLANSRIAAIRRAWRAHPVVFFRASDQRR